MSEALDFNPALPESRRFSPPSEGGNGTIYLPGDYQNRIFQSRSRAPERWELALIAALENLFAQGDESLEQLVSGLNALQMYDHRGALWSEESFSAFLQANGD